MLMRYSSTINEFKKELMNLTPIILVIEWFCNGILKEFTLDILDMKKSGFCLHGHDYRLKSPLSY